MKVKGHWQGIPGTWLANGKRFVATEYGWKKLRLGAGCHGACMCSETCTKIGVEWHHRFGRGGGKRDDRIYLPDGTQNLLWISRECHQKLKIERRS